MGRPAREELERDTEANRLVSADQPRHRSYYLADEPESTYERREEAAHARRSRTGPAERRAVPILGSQSERSMIFTCGHPLDAPLTCPLDMVLHGRRVDGEADVRVWWSPAFLRWTPLELRLELANHSITGPEWGYPGSGPAQLALAACALVVGDERAMANGLYQRVRGAMFDGLRAEEWLLHAADLETLVLALEAGQPAGRLGANLVNVVIPSAPHA
jgi:hypothetical protein